MYIELDMAIIGEMIFDSLVSNMRDRWIGNSCTKVGSVEE
jgi:hypothetical protein